MTIIIEYLFVKYFSVISVCWKQHFLLLRDSTKNTFDIISIAQKAGKLSAVYSVTNIFYGHLVQYLLTILTYLLICKFQMCESVQNFDTHHTDFTPFTSLFCIHDIMTIVMSIAMVAELRRAFSISWLGYGWRERQVPANSSICIWPYKARIDYLVSSSVCRPVAL